MSPGLWLAAAAAACAVGSTSAAESGLLSAVPLAEPGARHKLPRALDEVSGLATNAKGELLAHEDQNAIVYALDRESGAVTRTFALGQSLRGDFEGIAAHAGEVFLTTSTGKVVRGPEGEDRATVDYEVFDTGVAAHCLEIEGLAIEPATRRLVLACKHGRDGSGDTLLFRWSLDDRALVEPVWRSLPAESLRLPERSEAFLASGIARDPRTGHWLLLAASVPAVAELSADGELIEVRALERRRHRQPEGITADDAAVWIADEGAGKRARLARYERSEEAR